MWTARTLCGVFFTPFVFATHGAAVWLPLTLLSGVLVLSSDVRSAIAESPRNDGVPPASAGDSKRGETLFRASCVVCHGPEASGGIGPKLAGNPVLADDQAFWKIVHDGRHVMPPQKGLVTDQQLNDIRAWLRTLP